MLPFEIFNLTGKTALITGASSGLGKRFAEILSLAGARIILTSIQKKPLQTLSNQLKNAIALEMDVSNKIAVKNTFNQLEQSGEKIDIVICSAGIRGLTPIFGEEESDETFEHIMQTNLMGIWYVTRNAAKHMKKHKIAGSIINIASVRGTQYLRETITGYCASKAAIIQLTKALTGELAKEKIRINCIVPGLFHTPFTEKELGTPEKRQEMASPVPLQFAAEPEDLDGAILYLASNKASGYVTGSCLTVDGGVTWGGFAGK